MKRESFIFYRSFYEAIKDLPRDIQGEVYTAIMEYSLNGITTENLKPVARSIFTLVKPVIDTANARSEAGTKGGKSRSKTEANAKQNESKTEANAKPPRSDRDRDRDREEERDDDMPPNGGVLAHTCEESETDEIGQPKTSSTHGSTYTDTETLYRDYRTELTTETQASNAALRLCKSYGHTLERVQLGTFLDQFQDTRRTAGDTHATHSDYRRHFTNWLLIQIKNQSKPQNNANTTEQRKKVSKSSNQYFTDF
ncbi:MAG: hypothetical protein IJU19_00650 [Bacteroidales bacterium]|nr:hypothetical protein [Bacteroidales bacterium]